MKSINSRAKTPRVTVQQSARITALLQRLATTAALLGACAAIQACGGAALHSAPPSHDEPVPASEQRAELKLELELEQRAGCEEDFDLALYQDPGVELIEWKEPFGVCKARQVTIRYLPKRTSRDALLGRIKELAQEVKQR
ncbi:MAG: hypothetical protein H6718_11630 [Polyangiaceae bacterium]|nr:hypothetical protein [Myxococcales bacterium]MCB9586041.1 hypothetical protein [Polyangiaceae bacterium]MCB9608943.1 hypothetical protein [Polyangiaceae bacterium]